MSNRAQTHEFHAVGTDLTWTDGLGHHAGMAAWSRMVDRCSARLFGTHRGVTVGCHADGQVLTFTHAGETVTVTQRPVQVL